MKLIIEPALSCSLTQERTMPNGHDCWGNYEWTTEYGVYINGEWKGVNSGWYVAHDGKRVIDCSLIDLLPMSLRQILDPNVAALMKQRRQRDYLELKKEFENDSNNNLS